MFDVGCGWMADALVVFVVCGVLSAVCYLWCVVISLFGFVVGSVLMFVVRYLSLALCWLLLVVRCSLSGVCCLMIAVC